MAKLLIVDDEPDIYQLIQRFAEHEGHETTGVASATEAVALCRQTTFDLVILDIMMPDMDGFTACKLIRQERDIPILMLSARGAEYDKLLGFELGVDDYVVKPFSPKELMARVNVIVNRHQKQQQISAASASAVSAPASPTRTAIPTASNPLITRGGIQIDTLGHTVRVHGVRTELTAKEYELLLYFSENPGIALSRTQILNAVWGYDYFGDERTVDWQMKLLRNKLGDCRSYLVTVRGVGYKFEPSV